jgi:glycosyltransferase involved in cell wall biosynthesis/SAM-dependent methyltransferase
MVANLGDEQKKQGIMIGFLTDGMVPAKWMMRIKELEKGVPSGMFWKYAWYEGKDYLKNNGGWAKARTEVVKQAIAHKAKWLFFIDSDVFPPPDVLSKLMAHGKDIVTGIYYMKTMPPQPVLFKEMGSGPYYNFPVEELFEVEGSGLGCCLINMEIFEKFDEKGLPYFQENWLHEKADGSKVRINIGEDHWFFMKAKELGYKIWCDSSVLCDHLDTNTGAFFPGKEECDKIRNKVLEKQGRGDIIEKEKDLYNLDRKKKTIIFYNATQSAFSGDEMEKRGVGGSEGDIINLAKIFAKKYNVVVFCNCPRPGIYEGVRYLHVSDTEFMNDFKTDLFVSSRNTQLLSQVNFKEHFKVDKVCLWTHDLPDSYVFDKLPKAIPNIDKIFALTEWHRAVIEKKFPMVPKEMWFNARNGVDQVFYDAANDHTIKRNPKKLIYASTPFRGLDILLDVFPKIKEFEPEAELHIFSSMKVYGEGSSDDPYKPLYDKAQKMPGVVYHGTVKRKELAKHFKESAVLAYPNTYPETMCITAAQAVVTGTPVVTTKMAALPEIVPSDAGFLIDKDPKTDEYKKEFIDKCVALLREPALFEEMSKGGKDRDYSWEGISIEWIKEFFPDDVEDFSKKIQKNKKIKVTPKEIKIINGKPSENINTPEYWDKQYAYELTKGVSNQRTDTGRWDIMLEKIQDGDTVLDVGCGLGNFLKYLKEKKPTCARYGTDISVFALKKLGEIDRSIRTFSRIEDLPVDLSDGYFDFISIQHVIEHVDDPKEFIEQYKPLLARGGTMCVAIPIDDDPWPEHQKIWQLDEFKKFLDTLNCEYEVVNREKTMRLRKDGRDAAEALAFIKFKEDE